MQSSWTDWIFCVPISIMFSTRRSVWRPNKARVATNINSSLIGPWPRTEVKWTIWEPIIVAHQYCKEITKLSCVLPSATLGTRKGEKKEHWFWFIIIGEILREDGTLRSPVAFKEAEASVELNKGRTQHFLGGLDPFLAQAHVDHVLDDRFWMVRIELGTLITEGAPRHLHPHTLHPLAPVALAFHTVERACIRLLYCVLQAMVRHRNGERISVLRRWEAPAETLVGVRPSERFRELGGRGDNSCITTTRWVMRKSKAFGNL